MAKRIKGITIELDGSTKGLDKALQGVNKRSRDLNTELRDVDKLLKFNPGNTDLIAQKQKLLGEQVENTADKLKQLKDAQKQVNQQFESGAIDESQYRAFQREIAETESKLKTFEGKLESSQKKVSNFGDTMKNAGDKMKGIGNSMSTGFTAPVVAGLGLVTKGTEEFREDLSRLEQNAKNAGIGTDVMKNALITLNGVTGEADSNVEALSNLLATGFDQEGLTGAMDALSGAVIKFPDTLKIEGLADGLQETVATGKAIGPFAELLERMGVNLEDFDKGLANAAKSGEEQNYVLEELAKTGLADVNEAYRKNNEELVKSRESSASFQQAIAQLGKTLAPIVTKATEFITGLITKFNELSPSMQKIILVVTGIVAVVGPLLTMVGMLTIAIGAISLPILAVIAGITALIGIGVLLWKNWDTIKVKAIEIWNAIKTFLKATWDGIKSTATTVFNGIKNAISNVWNTVKSTTSSIWNGIKNTISGIVNGIKSAVSSAFNGIKDTISGVWDSVSGATDKIWNGITDSIKGAINGVISAINAMINALNSLDITLPKIPDWVPVLGGKGGGTIGFPNIPNIPKLRTGTNYVQDEGLAYLHEGEAVVPKKYNPAAGAQSSIDYEKLGKAMAKYLNFEFNVDGEKFADAVNTHNAINSTINSF